MQLNRWADMQAEHHARLGSQEASPSIRLLHGISLHPAPNTLDSKPQMLDPGTE